MHRLRLSRFKWGLCLTLLMLTQSASSEGDPARGRAIVTDRQRGFCLLCHSGPYPEDKFQGDLAPPLSEVVRGKTADGLRLTLVDPTRMNPSTIMPRYGSLSRGARIHPQFQGQTILSPQDIEDVVAHLIQLQP